MSAKSITPSSPSEGLSIRRELIFSDEKLREKLEDLGFPMYIVCNSLQALAKLDLLPIWAGTTKNDSGKHETNFWDLKINNGASTHLTRGKSSIQDCFFIIFRK